MRLGAFILHRLEPILAEWETFAATLLPAASHLNSEALRDHAEAMLKAIALDMSTEQSGEAQALKSKGLAPSIDGAPRTAAQSHATLRARDGFDINQMTSEYRALRASVLRLWLAEGVSAADDMLDIIRFNEAIDQALAESVRDFSLAVEKGRNLLLGMLGHDMRSPLSVIVTTASYLTKLNAGEEVSVAAARLINSGARIQALVTDLVDFSRSQLGVGFNVVPAPVNLAKVFRDELDLQLAANPGRQITLEVRGNVVGHWDGSRIHQVLGNLLSNALQYGSINTPVKVTLDGDAEHLRFSVANQGTAIPTHLLDKIFEPMTRGVQMTGDPLLPNANLGLGLYIAREIVRAHKGTITVRSDETETAFIVDLPR
jgi:signal transduction histidine kinase